MEGRDLIDAPIVAMAIKLVQPCLLGDVLEGVKRLLPVDIQFDDRDIVSSFIKRLISENIVQVYTGRRYILTEIGEDLVQATGVRYQLDVRRMFLLSETRRSSLRLRSDTRDRSLQQ